MAMNVTTATFCQAKRETTTLPIWQYDYGQVLKFSGIELPETYEVHFSTSLTEGETMTQIGSSDGVTIPDELLTLGEYVYAWIFLHEGQEDGETEYMITIPVKQRPKPSNEEPTPEQQDIITQTIAVLNTATSEAQTAAQFAGSWAIPFDPDSEDSVIGSYISAVTDDTEEWTEDELMMESGYIPIRKGDLLEILNDGHYVNGTCVPIYNEEKILIGYSGTGMQNCYYMYGDAAYCRIPMEIENKDKYIVRRRVYPDLPDDGDGTYVLSVQMRENMEPVFGWVTV